MNGLKIVLPNIFLTSIIRNHIWDFSFLEVGLHLSKVRFYFSLNKYAILWYFLGVNTSSFDRSSWKFLSKLKAVHCDTNGKEPAYQCRRCKRYRFDPWVGKIPWRRKQQPAPVFLLGESHGQASGAWQAIVHRVTKSWTRPRRLSMRACSPGTWCMFSSNVQ